LATSIARGALSAMPLLWLQLTENVAISNSVKKRIDALILVYFVFNPLCGGYLSKNIPIKGIMSLKYDICIQFCCKNFLDSKKKFIFVSRNQLKPIKN
jgi:hypothetical protein